MQQNWKTREETERLSEADLLLTIILQQDLPRTFVPTRGTSPAAKSIALPSATEDSPRILDKKLPYVLLVQR